MSERFPRLRKAIEDSPLKAHWLFNEADETLKALSDDYAEEERAEASGEVHEARLRLKEAFEHVLHGGVTR